MVNNPKFQTALKQKIGSKIDTSELDKEKVVLNKQLQQAIGAKNKIAEQMDRLDITDKHYDRKYEDMQNRFFLRRYEKHIVFQIESYSAL